MIRTLALSGLVALAAACGASAQTVLHYREGQRVEPQDVKQILGNADGDRDGTRTRSIRMLSDDRAGAGAAPDDAAPSALSLPIQFEFDSTALSPSARDQLNALAEGIKLLPPERRVIIEGHTDAHGSEDYNQQLSLRRAAAVKLYLVQTYGIDAQRLSDTGFGKRQPIAGADPYAPENRRVQFRGS